MIAVDTNVLVYAARSEMPLHASAFAALTQLAEGRRAWGLPIFCVGEFLRIVSHPRILRPPMETAEALGLIDALLASPSVRLLVPGAGYLPLLRGVLAESGARGNLVFDAQIAALCLESGATSLLTEDRDFARFTGLRVTRLEDMAR
ncbi:MAG: PIN domain-containing protein [Deltaproteobacteria bacterium]|nr:PIN domain-containing protein [Deltaproteobacteria bacterium]